MLVALLFLLTAAEANAQFGGSFGRGGMGGPPGGGMDGPPDSSEGGANRRSVSASGNHLADELMRQLDNLRSQLRLRPDQEAAWSTYQERVGAMLSDQLRPRQEKAVQGNAMQQIGRQVDGLRNRLAALEEVADAAGQLYRRLDDRQKALADRLLPATLPIYDRSMPAGNGPRSGPGGGEGSPPRR